MRMDIDQYENSIEQRASSRVIAATDWGGGSVYLMLQLQELSVLSVKVSSLDM